MSCGTKVDPAKAYDANDEGKICTHCHFYQLTPRYARVESDARKRDIQKANHAELLRTRKRIAEDFVQRANTPRTSEHITHTDAQSAAVMESREGATTIYPKNLDTRKAKDFWQCRDKDCEKCKAASQDQNEEYDPWEDPEQYTQTLATDSESSEEELAMNHPRVMAVVPQELQDTIRDRCRRMQAHTGHSQEEEVD